MSSPGKLRSQVESRGNALDDEKSGISYCVFLVLMAEEDFLVAILTILDSCQRQQPVLWQADIPWFVARRDR